MRVGLSTYDVAADDFLDLARAADESGFESLWLGEHVVLPLGYISEHPTTASSTPQHHAGPIIDPTTTLVDPLLTLAAASATTSRMNLATGIYLLPLRHPIAVARALATWQQIARGRALFGVGSGWLREEFDALGVPFAERGSRLDESIDVIRALLAAETVTHAGPHFTFGPVRLVPLPVSVTFVLGGNSNVALRRAAQRADGWFSSGTPSFDEARQLRDSLGRHAASAGRSGEPKQWFRVASPSPELLDRYELDGFEQVVLWADEFWPREGELAMKREHFRAAIDRLGLSSRLAQGGTT